MQQTWDTMLSVFAKIQRLCFLSFLLDLLSSRRLHEITFIVRIFFGLSLIPEWISFFIGLNLFAQRDFTLK